MVGVASQVHEVRQRMVGQADPPLFDAVGQLFGGSAGKEFGVAVGAGTAQYEQETASHEIPQVSGVRQIRVCASHVHTLNLARGAAAGPGRVAPS